MPLTQQQSSNPGSSSSVKMKIPLGRKVGASFAPDTFEFRFNLPPKTVAEDPQEPGFNEEDTHTPDTPTPVKLISEAATNVIEESPTTDVARLVPTEEVVLVIPEASASTSTSPE